MKLTTSDTIMRDGKIIKVDNSQQEYKYTVVSDTIPKFVQDVDGKWIKNPFFVQDVDGKWKKNPDCQVESNN